MKLKESATKEGTVRGEYGAANPPSKAFLGGGYVNASQIWIVSENELYRVD